MAKSDKKYDYFLYMRPDMKVTKKLDVEKIKECVGRTRTVMVGPGGGHPIGDFFTFGGRRSYEDSRNKIRDFLQRLREIQDPLCGRVLELCDTLEQIR